MRISVTKSGSRIYRLRLPTSLVLNGLSAGILSSSMRTEAGGISGKQLRILFRAARKYKRSHPEWKLLEIQNQDGTAVEIVV